MTKHIILFLAANPGGTERLALDEEARAIRVALERSDHRDRFKLETRWAARPVDLLDELRKLKPTVVHFSGHGGRGELQPGVDARRDIVAPGSDKSTDDGDRLHGLYFQAPDGRRQFVSAAALTDTLGAAGSSVQLVVLNACYSEVQAKALLAHANCVVGMTGSIRDDVARSFAVGLYGGLGQGQSIGAAYKQGCAAINLEGLADGHKPCLRTRQGIDADQLVLTDDVAMVQDLIMHDLAKWGERHVFGNVPRDRWNADESIPFLPLKELYVEPDGKLEQDGKPQPSEPLIALIERLTEASAAHRIVIVKADFGSGKSLSARELARRWAERRLTSAGRALDIALPIYVRCAEDFPSETVDLELTVRRAWKRQADSIGHSVADDDASFAWPSPEQRMICLLDGLDEVSLGEQHLRTLFQKLLGKTTSRHRFVLFSRPGAVPAQRDLGTNVAVIHLQPFSPSQIEQWLARWNSLSPDDRSLTLEDLVKRDVLAIAQTPILLFMLVFTWSQETTSGWRPSTAEIYERFFHQVASGKASADSESHRPIAVASDKLLAALKNAHLIDAGAQRSDAMLWLMGRVAWEAHMLEQRRPSEAMTRWHIDTVLRESEALIPPDAIDVIRVGLVLTLQVDLHGANHTFLFGHKSFREFLVGRHWASVLRQLIRGRHSSDPGAKTLLLGGRLLGQDDESFDYLMQLINAHKDVDSRSTSPLGWSDDERERLVRWAQESFEDESQEFGERGRTRRRAEAILYNDQRAELREAALAIGSMTKGSAGMRTNNPLTLRSMLAWFWLIGERARVIAPRANLTGVILFGADLSGADLSGADLSDANLSDANLSPAKLSDANLSQAQLFRTNLSGADLLGANLKRAFLSGAHLVGATLSQADLRGADLIGATLSRAELRGADLRGAIFRGAVLRGADLRGADLGGADLSGADLSGADLRGADLSGADLSGADLSGADLRGVDLHGTDLSVAVLSETSLRDADLNRTDLSMAVLHGTSPRGEGVHEGKRSESALTEPTLNLELPMDFFEYTNGNEVTR